jgi:hypothetical protein
VTVADDTETRPAPTRPGPRRRWWSPTLAFGLGAALAVWGFSIGAAPISDNSFFTHLATGRWIVSGHGIPRHDIYSFTARGTPWVVQSWLASTIYGWIDRAFGGQGLRVLTGVLAAVVAAMTWRLTRPAKSLIGRIVVGAFVVGLGETFWSPRPLMFGLVLLTVALLAAEGGLPAWVLVPAFWLWVNTHGSFPLGLVAIGALWLGRRADQQAGDTELRCLGYGVLGTVLGAINPLGPALLTFPVHLLSRMDVLRNVIEWQSPNFSDGWARLFLLQVAVAVVLLVRKPSYRSAIPLVLFTAAALLGLRNVPVASLVLVPGMARGFAGIGSLKGDQRTPVSAVVLVAVVLVGLLVAQATLARPTWSLETFPVAPVAWMAEHDLHRPDLPTASSDTTGNYLELVYGAKADVFLDDRVDMFPVSVVDDFLTLEHGAPAWQHVLDKRGVQLVLWPRTMPLTNLMAESGDWRTLYEDKDWVVTCRHGAPLRSAELGQRC